MCYIYVRIRIEVPIATVETFVTQQDRQFFGSIRGVVTWTQHTATGREAIINVTAAASGTNLPRNCVRGRNH